MCHYETAKRSTLGCFHSNRLDDFFCTLFFLFVWRAVMDYWQQFVSFALQSGHFVGEMCNFSFDVFNYPALKMNFFF